VPRESPFGTTNREQKNGLEFGQSEFEDIDKYCKEKGIEWFASAWDLKSLDFLSPFNGKYNKVASAMLTIDSLVGKIAKEGKYTFISTGMSTMDEIKKIVEIFEKENCPFELMHCNSSYPMENSDANLATMKTLKDTFNCKVGYSGHERGLQVSLAAVALGATSIERHITLDRTMYGSDQSASIEPTGLIHLVRDIRVVESAIGSDEKIVTEKEKKIRSKLAHPYWTNQLR
jgi:N-acetylneuraminate synthase